MRKKDECPSQSVIWSHYEQNDFNLIVFLKIVGVSNSHITGNYFEIVLSIKFETSSTYSK